MLTLISGPTEVSQLCPSELANSNCSGGTQPGTQRYVFERILTLSFANCGTNQNWRVGFSFAARNNSITNLQNPGATDLYIEANIRQSAGLGSNSSPVFNVLPVPYVCIGQPVIYTHGAFDAEGDSLVFSSITPLAAGGAPALYNAGFSSINPLTTSGGFTVNPSSGQLSYTPSQIQVAVITLLVQEYRNNVLISSTMRDLQVIVRNCTGINANPPNATQAQNLSGASLSGNVIQVCVGSSVSFQFTASDPDAGTVLTLTDDHSTSIPSSTLTYSGSGNSVTGSFIWTPTAADVGPNSFSVTISDNSCPISAVSAVSFLIQVNNCSNPCPNVATTAPSPICNNTTLNLSSLQQTNQAGTWSVTSAPSGSNPASIAGSTLNAIGKDPGTYTIRFTLTTAPPAGCASFSQQTLTILASPNAAISPATASVCPGGSATLTASGGTTYAWSNGSNTAAITVSPLINTTYTVTVLDANNCSATASASVSVQLPVSFTVNLTNPSCGNNNGSISLSVPAGTPSSYSWSANANTGNSPNASGLGAGIYQVSVTQNGCTRDTTLSLNSGSSLTATISNPLAPTCAGNDGSIDFSLSGGTAPYTITVDTGGSPFIVTLPFPIAQTFSNLPAGTIQISVTDANGCVASATETLNAPTNCCSLAIAGIVLIPTTCGNADGSISLLLSNASPAVTIDCVGCNWVPDANGATANGLASGTYTITISDPTVVNCQIDTTIILNNTNGPVLTNVQVLQETCAGTADGSVSLNVSGGSAPLSFSWSANASTGNSATASALSTGTYGYTITDASGCAITGTSFVGLGICCNLQTTATSVGTTCGLANGSVTIDVISGGTPGYSYSINGLSPQNSNQFSNLNSGSYTLITNDANGCLDTLTITVAASIATLNVNVTTTNDPTCFGFSDGSISAIAGGQSGNVNWLWSNGQTTPSISSLSAGNYGVTVTDENNCTASTSAILNNPLAITVNLGEDTAVCNGLPFTLTAPTGYDSYLWGTGETSTSITIPSAGTYSLSVTDINGCSASDQISISTGSAAYLDAGPDIEIYAGNAVAISPIFSSSSTGLFSWSPSTGLNCSDCFAPIASPEASTLYLVTFTDINGCIVSDSLNISIIPPPVLFFPNAFSPNGDGNNDEFKAIGNVPIYYQLLIFNRWGEKVFETNNFNDGWNGEYMGEQQSIGVYVYTASVTLADKTNRSLTGSVTLVR